MLADSKYTCKHLWITSNTCRSVAMLWQGLTLGARKLFWESDWELEASCTYLGARNICTGNPVCVSKSIRLALLSWCYKCLLCLCMGSFKYCRKYLPYAALKFSCLTSGWHICICNLNCTSLSPRRSLRKCCSSSYCPGILQWRSWCISCSQSCWTGIRAGRHNRHIGMSWRVW